MLINFEQSCVKMLAIKRKNVCLRFSSCFEFIISSHLYHVGPCCVLGHFQLLKNNDAFSAIKKRRNKFGGRPRALRVVLWGKNRRKEEEKGKTFNMSMGNI